MDPGVLVCRVLGLIVLNSVCFGVPSIFIHSLVRLAGRKPRNTGDMVVVSIFFFWVIIIVRVYPFYRVLFPRSAPRNRARQRNSEADATIALPQFVVLPREPPVRDGAGMGVPSSEQQGVMSQEQDNIPECPVCLSEMEKGEMVKWLPLCLHMFHQHCIDRWLRDHSTCPICQCNAFVSVPTESMIRFDYCRITISPSDFQDSLQNH